MPTDLSQQEDELSAFTLMEHLGQQNCNRLNFPEAVLHNLHWCSAIACANGFEGLLFDRMTARHIPEMLVALKDFGAAKCAKLLEEGVAAFPARNAVVDSPELERQRLALRPADRQLLKRLSEAFSVANDKEINEKTLLAYVRKNAETIRFTVSRDKKTGKFRLLRNGKAVKSTR